MRDITKEQFAIMISQAVIKSRLKRELRFMAQEEWAEREIASISDRSGNRGVLLLEPYNTLYLVTYEFSRGITDRRTGRAQPIICDFCRTWQPGSNGATITFQPSTKTLHSVSYLCCADLACSDHVRGKTSAADRSRTQLREDITNEQRVERLKQRLNTIASDLNLHTVQDSERESTPI